MNPKHRSNKCQSIYSVIYLLKLYTLQSTPCSPLPLLLCRQSLSFPLTKGLSIIPAHVNDREFQALPNSRTRSCRLGSRGSNQLNAESKRVSLKILDVLNSKTLTCLQNARSTGNHQGADWRVKISRSLRCVHNVMAKCLSTIYVC